MRPAILVLLIGFATAQQPTTPASGTQSMPASTEASGVIKGIEQTTSPSPTAGHAVIYVYRQGSDHIILNQHPSAQIHPAQTNGTALCDNFPSSGLQKARD